MNKIDLTNNTINGVKSYFLEYYDAIFNRGWIAGYEVRTLLNNLLEDLEYYDYRPKEAHFRIDAGQKFHRQTKNKFHGKLIKFMKWQKAFIEVIYSFYIPGTDELRFKEALLLVARKNGKSTLIADDLLIDLFFGPGGQDICVSSNDDSQADLIYQEVDNARIMMDPSSKYTKKNQKGITNRKSYSRIFKISDRTKNKEGRNITKASIDEIHEMKDNEIAMAIRQSTSIGNNTLIIQISTEGVVDDGYLDKELIKARHILKKELEDQSFLPWLYTQDSTEEVFQDESSWWKSNPSLHEVKSISYLRKAVEDARTKREDRPWILCKDFNIKQSNSIGWLIEDEISRNLDTFELESFKNSYYIGGTDISETTDLTAFCALFEKDGIKYTHVMYFVPSSKATRNSNTNPENKDYLQLQRDGLVRIVEGNEVNTNAIVSYQWELWERFKVRPFKNGYDNWMAKDYVNNLKDRFGDEVPERVRMDFASLSTPMRSLGADLKDGKVNYQNNLVTKWCLKNVGVITNNQGQIMPKKVQGTGVRIDGAVAMMIAYHVRSKYVSEWEAFIRR